MRKIGQHLEIKIAPDQLGQPDARPRVTGQLRPQRAIDQLADGHRAKTQMHAKVARAFHCREVARVLIGAHTRCKVGQQGLGTGLARFYA